MLKKLKNEKGFTLVEMMIISNVKTRKVRNNGI
ncbi:prepilin-type N-terminal cleavage/methylation domain-containing protein [Psychrobacillus sp.]